MDYNNISLHPHFQTISKVQLYLFIVFHGYFAKYYFVTIPNEFFGFKELTEIVIKANVDKSKKNINIELDPNPSPRIKIMKIPFLPLEISKEEFQNYIDKSKAIWQYKMNQVALERNLDEVVVKGKKNDVVRNGKVLYRRENGSSIDVSSETRFQGYSNVFQVIKGRIPGVNISGDVNNPTVSIRGASSISLGSDPLYLLDGMPVDKSQLLNIMMTDVDKIDVLKGPANAAIYGDAARNGIVSVLTNRNNEKFVMSNESEEGVRVLKRQGYSKNKEFYVPVYDDPKNAIGLKDYRSSVYWNPSIKTDKNGKASVSFFATDASTKLQVNLEGINYYGQAAVAKHSFEIR